MANPNETDPDLKDNFQAAIEESSTARAVRDAIDGYTFSTGHLFQGITDGTTVGILLENPGGSGVINFVSGTMSADGKTYVRKTDSVTVDSAGTSITPNNRNISDGASKANVEYNPTVSGGNQWSRKVFGASSSVFLGQQLYPGTSSDFGILIQPGENVYYEATNASGSNIDVSINIDYTEIPSSEVQL